jgi:HSP20 family molecular chaperone IbpA
LPENTESSGISAKYEDGVLCVSIPKKAEAQKESGRKIKVD